MWKVSIHSRYPDGEPGIYWVAGESAADAERTARGQQNRASDIDDAPAEVTVEHADAIDPDGELWPRPQLVDGLRVHTFTDTKTGYDQTQYRPDIHDGDVLHIPAEQIAGFMMQAWPVAVSEHHGAFHRLADDTDLVIDGVDYTASADVALSLLPPRPAREHDCLAVEALRQQVLAWAADRDHCQTAENDPGHAEYPPRWDHSDDEAARLVRELEAIFQRGLS